MAEARGGRGLRRGGVSSPTHAQAELERETGFEPATFSLEG